MIYDICIICIYLSINVVLPLGSYWVFLDFFNFKVKKVEIIFGNFLLFNNEKMLLFKGEKLMFFIWYFMNFLLLIAIYIVYAIVFIWSSVNFIVELK